MFHGESWWSLPRGPERARRKAEYEAAHPLPTEEPARPKPDTRKLWPRDAPQAARHSGIAPSDLLALDGNELIGRSGTRYPVDFTNTHIFRAYYGAALENEKRQLPAAQNQTAGQQPEEVKQCIE